MKKLKAVRTKPSKSNKRLRFARNLKVAPLLGKLRSEKKLLKKTFEESDDINPYPICENYFKKKKCTKKKCLFLHVHESDICGDFDSNDKCEFESKCSLVHVSRTGLILNDATEKVDYVEKSVSKETWLKNDDIDIKSRIEVLDHLILVLKNCFNYWSA